MRRQQNPLPGLRCARTLWPIHRGAGDPLSPFPGRSGETMTEDAFAALSDSELAAQLLVRATGSYEELLRRHRGLVVSTAFGIIGDAEEAQDVAQEVFAIASQRIGQLQDRSRLRNWLASIARNTAIETLRRRRGPRVVSFEDLRRDSGELERLEGIPDGRPCPRTEAERNETFTILYQELDRLPDNYREPLLLRIMHDMPYQEIAETLSISLATAKIRIFRARDLLSVKLRERNVRLPVREAGLRRLAGDREPPEPKEEGSSS